jgi:hypothetical protein
MTSTMTSTEKVLENRLRRAAKRQGLLLEKSRRRDPKAIDHGLYALLDAFTGNPVNQTGRTGIHVLTLDDARVWLEA